MHQIRSLLVLILVGVMACTGCRSETDVTSTTAATASTPTKAAPTPSATDSVDDVGVYCDRLAALYVVRSEGYVGSAAHQADTESLIETAPEAVAAPLRTFATFLASGAVDPSDPDSNLGENWPAEVQAAIAEITAFNDASC